MLGQGRMEGQNCGNTGLYAQTQWLLRHLRSYAPVNQDPEGQMKIGTRVQMAVDYYGTGGRRGTVVGKGSSSFGPSHIIRWDAPVGPRFEQDARMEAVKDDHLAIITCVGGITSVHTEES